MYYTKKQIFYINSRNRKNGSHNNFSYILNIDPRQDFDRVVLLSASIPKSYYLIRTNKNTFTLEEDSVQVTVTIPPGNYNRNSLRIVLQNQLNLVSPNTWTYSVNIDNVARSFDRGKYIFTVSGNGSIQPKFIFTNNVFEVLGFDLNSTNTFVANQLISTNVINLTTENTIFVHSDICQNDTGDNILQEVFTSETTTFGYIYWQNNDPKTYAKRYIPGSNIFQFYLTDEDSNLIDLNGLNINLTIMIYKENNIDLLIRKYIGLKTTESLLNDVDIDEEPGN